MLGSEIKKSVNGIKGRLWKDDFLAITSFRKSGLKTRDFNEHIGEEWLSLSDNWTLDIEKAKEYYLAHKMELDKKLDSVQMDIDEGYEATKSAKLKGYSTFNAVSLYWNIDVHWVVLSFVREYIRNPESVQFNEDRWGNMIYIKRLKWSSATTTTLTPEITLWSFTSWWSSFIYP